jgi:hypothetical protein
MRTIQARIVAGQVTSHRVQMPQGGYVSVLCRPACEEVTIDGIKVGVMPVVRYPVSRGTHELGMRRGTIERSATLRVDEGQTATVRARMED